MSNCQYVSVKCSCIIFSTGQPVDGPYSGPAPLPWDIAVHAPNLFKTSEKKMEVPHTAGVKVGRQVWFVVWKCSSLFAGSGKSNV